MSNLKDNNIICPVSKFTEMLGGKWKLIIVDNIRKRDDIKTVIFIVLKKFILLYVPFRHNEKTC